MILSSLNSGGGPMLRERILAAAQRSLTIDPSASMVQIAEDAGVGRATLHRHFASRDALVMEIASRALDRFKERLDDAGIDELSAHGSAEEIAQALDGFLRNLVADG